MTARKARKSGSRVEQPAATATPRRLVPLALVLLLIVIYLFYYLDHLPQAETIKSSETWHASPGEQLRLQGMSAGPAIVANLRRRGPATLSFERGATLLPDPVEERSRPLTGRPLAFSLFNEDRENISIDVRLVPVSATSRPTIVLDSDRPDARTILLTVRSPDSDMRVDAAVVPNPSVQRHGQFQWDGPALHGIGVVVPRGTPFTLGLPAADPETLLLETGNLSAVEIGSEFEGEFERESIACGARRGQVLWLRLLPGIRLSDCRQGAISIRGFRLNEGIDLSLSGPGFATRNGATRYWKGFSDLRSNEVVRSLISALLVALVGWVAYVFRHRFGWTGGK